MVARAVAADGLNVSRLHRLWLEILNSAPPAPDGGIFSFWANVRCPECAYEFPYNNGNKDLPLRIFEPKIIVVDGVTIVADSPADSSVVRVQLASCI